MSSKNIQDNSCKSITTHPLRMLSASINKMMYLQFLYMFCISVCSVFFCTSCGCTQTMFPLLAPTIFYGINDIIFSMSSLLWLALEDMRKVWLVRERDVMANIRNFCSRLQVAVISQKTTLRRYELLSNSFILIACV